MMEMEQVTCEVAVCSAECSWLPCSPVTLQRLVKGISHPCLGSDIATPCHCHIL